MSTRLVPPDDVAWTVEDDGARRVFVSPLPRGPVLVLADTAAVVWQAATTGAEGSLVDRVAAATGQPVPLIRADVEAFVDDLVARGLLRRT